MSRFFELFFISILLYSTGARAEPRTRYYSLLPLFFGDTHNTGSLTSGLLRLNVHRGEFEHRAKSEFGDNRKGLLRYQAAGIETDGKIHYSQEYQEALRIRNLLFKSSVESLNSFMENNPSFAQWHRDIVTTVEELIEILEESTYLQKSNFNIQAEAQKIAMAAVQKEYGEQPNLNDFEVNQFFSAERIRAVLRLEALERSDMSAEFRAERNFVTLKSPEFLKAVVSLSEMMISIVLVDTDVRDEVIGFKFGENLRPRLKDSINSLQDWQSKVFSVWDFASITEKAKAERLYRKSSGASRVEIDLVPGALDLYTYKSNTGRRYANLYDLINEYGYIFEENFLFYLGHQLNASTYNLNELVSRLEEMRNGLQNIVNIVSADRVSQFDSAFVYEASMQEKHAAEFHLKLIEPLLTTPLFWQAKNDRASILGLPPVENALRSGFDWIENQRETMEQNRAVNLRAFTEDLSISTTHDYKQKLFVVQRSGATRDHKLYLDLSGDLNPRPHRPWQASYETASVHLKTLSSHKSAGTREYVLPHLRGARALKVQIFDVLRRELDEGSDYELYETQDHEVVVTWSQQVPGSFHFEISFSSPSHSANYFQPSIHLNKIDWDFLIAKLEQNNKHKLMEALEAQINNTHSFTLGELRDAFTKTSFYTYSSEYYLNGAADRIESYDSFFSSGGVFHGQCDSACGFSRALIQDLPSLQAYKISFQKSAVIPPGATEVLRHHLHRQVLLQAQGRKHIYDLTPLQSDGTSPLEIGKESFIRANEEGFDSLYGGGGLDSGVTLESLGGQRRVLLKEVERLNLKPGKLFFDSVRFKNHPTQETLILFRELKEVILLGPGFERQQKLESLGLRLELSVQRLLGFQSYKQANPGAVMSSTENNALDYKLLRATSDLQSSLQEYLKSNSVAAQPQASTECDNFFVTW